MKQVDGRLFLCMINQIFYSGIADNRNHAFIFQERRNGMETIQRTVCLGSRMYVPAKIVTHIFVAVGLEAVFSAFNFLIINKQYGLKGSAMMLYSISEYQYTPFDMSVLDFYFL